MKDVEIEFLLSEYFNGNLSEEERGKVESWIASGEDNRKVAGQVCHINHLACADKVNVEAALEKNHRMMRRRRLRRIHTYAQRVAAVLFIPLLGFCVYMAARCFRPDKVTMIEARSAAGMTSRLSLPDGTQVWLNSNTTLVYPSSFGQKDRSVTLEGEAYFQVAKQNGRKFTVSAGGVDVEVTGTEFNVEYYSDKNAGVTASLVSGSVNLCYGDISGRRHCLTMKPGETCVYDRSRESLVKEDRDLVVETSWKDGRIVLNNTGLDCALRMVENRYNVRFLINNDKLLENRYTGTLTGQSLDVILDFFKRTTDISFNYSMKGMDSDNVSGRQIIIVN